MYYTVFLNKPTEIYLYEKPSFITIRPLDILGYGYDTKTAWLVCVCVCGEEKLETTLSSEISIYWPDETMICNKTESSKEEVLLATCFFFRRISTGGNEQFHSP